MEIYESTLATQKISRISLYYSSASSGRILDLHHVRLSNTAPFCENYAELYFEAKHLKNGLNKGVGETFGGPSSKKCSFWPVSNTALKF